MGQHIQKIGLFDSGIGGLTVLRELYASAPNREYYYLGDTARTPYGAKSAPTIARYASECADFLLGFEIDLLVVACNTASSCALEHLSGRCPVPVIGTIEPAVESACAVTHSGTIGVIGTEATIASGVYTEMLRARDPALNVISIACPLFVPLVEQGMVAGDITDRVIDLYLAPLRAARVDTIILGCTHYPMLRDALQRYLGSSIQLIECSRVIARQVQQNYGDQHHAPEDNPRIRFFVTDEVRRFDRLSRLVLGTSIPEVTAHAAEAVVLGD